MQHIKRNGPSYGFASPSERPQMLREFIQLVALVQVHAASLGQKLTSFSSQKQSVFNLINETTALEKVAAEFVAFLRTPDPLTEIDALRVLLFRRCAEVVVAMKAEVDRHEAKSDADAEKGYSAWGEVRYLGQGIGGFADILKGYRLTAAALIVSTPEPRMKDDETTAKVSMDLIQAATEHLKTRRAILEKDMCAAPETEEQGKAELKAELAEDLCRIKDCQELCGKLDRYHPLHGDAVVMDRMHQDMMEMTRVRHEAAKKKVKELREAKESERREEQSTS